MRFYNTDSAKQTDLMIKFNILLNSLYNEKYIDSVAIDSYVQETQRYNPVPIDVAECLFNYDSLAVLEIISLLKGPDSELNKIAIAIRSVDMYLDDFRFSIEEKYLFIKNHANSFFNEFGAATKLKTQLNQKFKDNQKDLIPDIDSLYTVPKKLEAPLNQLKVRSSLNQQHISRILEVLGQDNNLKMEIVSNFIHLSFNRMFFANQRKYELMVYTFIERFYHSFLARKKNYGMTSEGQMNKYLTTTMNIIGS